MTESSGIRSIDRPFQLWTSLSNNQSSLNTGAKRLIAQETCYFSHSTIHLQEGSGTRTKRLKVILEWITSPVILREGQKWLRWTEHAQHTDPKLSCKFHQTLLHKNLPGNFCETSAHASEWWYWAKEKERENISTNTYFQRDRSERRFHAKCLR